MPNKFYKLACTLLLSSCLSGSVLAQEQAENKDTNAKEQNAQVVANNEASNKEATSKEQKPKEQSTNAAPNKGVGMISFGTTVDPQAQELLPNFNFNHDLKKNVVSFIKNDGSAKVFMQIMDPIPFLSTTKDYAQYIMDSYSGWGLKAQIQRRGFSFSYVDNSPCAATITYFDGASYLMFGACGKIEQDDIARALIYAKQKLNIDEHLYRSSLPSLYQ